MPISRAFRPSSQKPPTPAGRAIHKDPSARPRMLLFSCHSVAGKMKDNPTDDYSFVIDELSAATPPCPAPFAQPASPAAVDADGRDLSAVCQPDAGGGDRPPGQRRACPPPNTKQSAQTGTSGLKSRRRAGLCRPVEAGIMATPLPAMPVESLARQSTPTTCSRHSPRPLPALARDGCRTATPWPPGPLFNRAIHRALALLGRRQCWPTAPMPSRRRIPG